MGVHSASVNFASESALIEFDDHIVSESELARSVASAGYHMEIPRAGVESSHIEKEYTEKNKKVYGKGSEMISLKVLGMDSPHCAAMVEHALKKLDGIEMSDVDFSNQRAKIVFYPKKLSLQIIFKAITDAGYTPIEEAGDAEKILDREKNEREKQKKTMKLRIIVGGLLSMLIFLGSFPEWFPFIPSLLNNGWMLLLLTTPIVQ